MSDFFYPSLPSVFHPLDIDSIAVIQPHGSEVTVTKSKNKIQFSRNTNDHDCFVACKPTLDPSGDGSFWKVTLDTLGSNGWLVLGFIGNLEASNGGSYEDPTSYGWANDADVYHGGTEISGDNGWNGFIQGECLYFHLNATKLTMYSVKENKKFTMDVATAAYYIHFHAYTGSNWTL